MLLPVHRCSCCCTFAAASKCRCWCADAAASALMTLLVPSCRILMRSCRCWNNDFPSGCGAGAQTPRLIFHRMSWFPILTRDGVVAKPFDEGPVRLWGWCAGAATTGQTRTAAVHVVTVSKNIVN